MIRANYSCQIYVHQACRVASPPVSQLEQKAVIHRMGQGFLTLTSVACLIITDCGSVSASEDPFLGHTLKASYSNVETRCREARCDVISDSGPPHAIDIYVSTKGDIFGYTDVEKKIGVKTKLGEVRMLPGPLTGYSQSWLKTANKLVITSANVGLGYERSLIIRAIRNSKKCTIEMT
jgi:hypothetical protein